MSGGGNLCFKWQGLIGTAVPHFADRGVAPERGPVFRFAAKGEGVRVYFHNPDGSLLAFISYV